MDPASQIRRTAHEYADATALVVGCHEQTYGELFDRATRLTNALQAYGVASGDRVAMLGENGIETLEQVAACALGNYARVTLYSYHSADVNRYLLELTGTRALLVQWRLLPALAPLLKDLEDLLVIGYGAPLPAAPAGSLVYEDLLAAAATKPVIVPCRGEDVHIIRFSSGTTGKPKGIYHSIDRWMAYNNEWRWVTPMITNRSTYLMPGSIAHLGVAFLWQFLAVGGRFVLMPAFDAGEALRLIEAYQVTHTAVAPVMIRDLVDHPDAGTRDLSSLECVMYAGSPIATTTLRRAIERFGPVMFQLYAQSEVMPITLLQPYQHVLDGDVADVARLRSAGRGTPNVSLTVRGEEGEILPTGKVGEIAASSPGQMTGIWHDPEAERARILPDGAILTRDMGYLDDQGFLFLVDRKDDMIVSGGYNIWPSELEEVIASHPAVIDVCVVGVPSERWGETPRALIVPRATPEPDSASLERELIELTRKRLGSVKKVTSVELVEELPRSGAGKLLRSLIKSRFWTDDIRVGGS